MPKVQDRVSDAPVARQSDPITSFEAGEDSAAREASEFAVLDALRGKGAPMSDHAIGEYIREHELADRPYTDQRIRTARVQLVKKGLVQDAGIEPNASATGRRAHVWAVSA